MGPFFICAFILLSNCATKNNFQNSFTIKQQKNVEIFTVRETFILKININYILM